MAIISSSSVPGDIFRAAMAALMMLASAPLQAQDDYASASSHERELGCMAQAIVYEAGQEPLEGQQAVAQVILNRVRAPAYPKTVCGVVYQGSNRRTGCQFTFTCDGSLARGMSERRYIGARGIAEDALRGRLPDRVGNATHYHASYVSPYWAPSLTRIGRIGAHIFYSSGRGGHVAGQAGSARASYVSASAAPRADTRPFLPWGLSLAPEPGQSGIN